MDSFHYLVPVCGPGSRVIAKFLDFTQIEDFREKLFIANFFRVFVKTPHGRILDLSVVVSKGIVLNTECRNEEPRNPILLYSYFLISPCCEISPCYKLMSHQIPGNCTTWCNDIKSSNSRKL